MHIEEPSEAIFTAIKQFLSSYYTDSNAMAKAIAVGSYIIYSGQKRRK